MLATLYLLDLNNPKRPEKRLQVADRFFFGRNPDRIITNPHDIPKTGTLILYILGHAVPDALVVPSLEPFGQGGQVARGGNSLLPEQEFAEFLTKQRGNNKTLLIWDLCFARSFEQIAGPGWTGMPYVHIFGSESYEQAWHTGNPDNATDPQRETLFSRAFKEATMEGGFDRWADLEGRLTRRLEPVQHPCIVGRCLPAEFGVPAALQTAPPPPEGIAVKGGTSGVSPLTAFWDAFIAFVRSISRALSS